MLTTSTTMSVSRAAVVAAPEKEAGQPPSSRGDLPVRVNARPCAVVVCLVAPYKVLG
jgi:hypothetical protein